MPDPDSNGISSSSRNAPVVIWLPPLLHEGVFGGGTAGHSSAHLPQRRLVGSQTRMLAGSARSPGSPPGARRATTVVSPRFIEGSPKSGREPIPTPRLRRGDSDRPRAGITSPSGSPLSTTVFVPPWRSLWSFKNAPSAVLTVELRSSAPASAAAYELSESQTSCEIANPRVPTQMLRRIMSGMTTANSKSAAPRDEVRERLRGDTPATISSDIRPIRFTIRNTP